MPDIHRIGTLLSGGLFNEDEDYSKADLGERVALEYRRRHEPPNARRRSLTCRSSKMVGARARVLRMGHIRLERLIRDIL